jgi:two-component system sensor kinase FixL
MIYLEDYAAFVRNNKLEDFVSIELRNIHSFNIPLMQFFTHLTEDELRATLRKSLLKLLEAIENGTAINQVKVSLENWKNNGITGVPREAISLRDITLIYSAQKLSLQAFIPDFTTEVSIAANLINEIELYYKQVQELTLQMLEAIQQEEYEKRLESDEKYKDLFDNANDLIQLTSPDGEILYVNKAWTETTGYNTEELKGRSILDFLKESERKYYKDYRERIIAGEKIKDNLKTVYITKSGEEINVEGYLSCKYKDGKPQYTMGILRNVTDKISQEKKINFYINQLAEREAYLSHVIESAPDAVIVIDSENTIQLWNPKAEEIFGWKEEEVKGMQLSEIIFPASFREKHYNEMKRYLATQKSSIINKTIELTAIHKNRNEFYISLTLSHAVQEGKDIFISFIRDITQQKKIALELENKRKQLEKSNQELEQFAWLTSHDLKEPLRKILTFSDALIKKHNDNDPATSLNYLKKIHRSANRMNELIEAVLLYSNVATDKDLFSEVNLNEVVRDVLEDLELVITSKNAVIEIDPLPVVHAIPIQMRQLFQNLISNAIKYSKPEEAPHVHINSTDIGEHFKITVKDNGIGFQNVYAEKIFQVFQRLLTNKIYEGTGIGLALCKKIIEAHNGTIHAESEEGVGSHFIVHLPKRHEFAATAQSA